MSIRLKINGKDQALDVPGDTPLLWALREELGLNGAKYGCGAGVCGACTVTMDGEQARACIVSLEEAAGKSVLTIEGLGGTSPIQQAWLIEDAPQCGYCQPGMIMATVALLDAKPDPTDADIDEAVTNICRCGTYPQIRAAIHRAAKLMKGKRK